MSHILPPTPPQAAPLPPSVSQVHDSQHIQQQTHNSSALAPVGIQPAAKHLGAPLEFSSSFSVLTTASSPDQTRKFSTPPPLNVLPQTSPIRGFPTDDNVEDIENTEKVDDTIEEVFSEIPASVNQLIEQLSQSGIEQERCRELHHKILSVWNIWQISGDHLKPTLDKEGEEERLGQGGTGVVKAMWLLPGNEPHHNQVEMSVAVKVMTIQVQEISSRAPQLLRELFIQISLSHHCILKTYGAVVPKTLLNVMRISQQQQQREQNKTYNNNDEQQKDPSSSSSSSASFLLKNPAGTLGGSKSYTARIVMERMTHNLAEAVIYGLLIDRHTKRRDERRWVGIVLLTSHWHSSS